MRRVESIDSLFLNTFVFMLNTAELLNSTKRWFWCQREMFLARMCLTWAELVGVYREREASEPTLHTLQPQRTWVTAFTQGDCGVCKLAWFPFGQKLLQKPLSRHYFWIGELDRGQLYPACVVICLAYFCQKTVVKPGLLWEDKLMAENGLKWKIS